jgi:trimethylamine-N-oxide reductase (cytochrome c)
VPHWIPSGESQQESRLLKKAEKYPLLLVSNHSKWRVHAEHDDISWLREIQMCKVQGPDGYSYEPVWINPLDAKSRDIEDGDIVRLFNERGAILGGARVTERIIAGALSQDHGARYDPLSPGLDRGGSNNLLAPQGKISRNCLGAVTSGFLVEVEKVNWRELENQYPGTFAGSYDAAAGLCFDKWVVKSDAD